MVGFEDTKDKILFGVVALLCAGAVSWAGWTTITLFNCPSYEQVHKIVSTSAPYIEDRQFIRDRLKRSEETDKKLIEVIERNTEAINNLKFMSSKGVVDAR